MSKPESNEYAAAYARYVEKVPDGEIVATLEQQGAETERLLTAAGEERGSFRYADGKWSVKQVIGHITDAERVFAYRLLSFARGEQQPLPGFDENAYMESSSFDAQPLADLVDAFAAQRRSTVLLMRQLSDEAWTRRGIASENPITVRALAWIIAGHERHHVGILRERYGLS
jgi:uncharacterized damage-inducible protein DinB